MFAPLCPRSSSPYSNKTIIFQGFQNLLTNLPRKQKWHCSVFSRVCYTSVIFIILGMNFKIQQIYFPTLEINLMFCFCFIFIFLILIIIHMFSVSYTHPNPHIVSYLLRPARNLSLILWLKVLASQYFHFNQNQSLKLEVMK